MKNLENRSTYALFPANGFLTIFIFSNLFDPNLLFKDLDSENSTRQYISQ